ncbi:unnamed protein product [Colias eurytheme]|nr:unnamed protein product [Colias eurytheme]
MDWARWAYTLATEKSGPNPDFYVWGHMKSLVYSEPNQILSVQELRTRIINAANQIRGKLTTGVVKSGLRKRLRKCVQNRGGHVEHEI